jgi:heptose I phosphotransferase
MLDALRQRLRLGLWREQCQPDWFDFVAPDWRDTIFLTTVRDRFHAKQGRSIARWTLHADDRRLTVYLKRHDRAAWWQGWAAALWPGRGWSAAWQEAEHLRWAADHGFLVPRPVAVGERIGPWGRLQSFLAAEELTGCVGLHEAVPAAALRLSPPAFLRWKRGLVAALAQQVARLHGLQRFHKDLYLCHFFIPDRLTYYIPAGWSNDLSMIDLHRLGHHPWLGPWWQLKDLAQLLYSSEILGVTARDRLRFWRQYAGPDRRRGWWPWLRRGVLVRWRNYRRHNEGRAEEQQRAA